MKTIGYYLKQTLIPILYMVFATMIAIGILCIDNSSLIWLKVILLVLNIALFGVIISLNFFKEGQTALKVRIANDMEREQIVLTGENRPLKLIEEFKPWKGFVIGFVSTFPLIILLVIHTIGLLANGASSAGGIASIAYIFVFGFWCLDLSAITTALAPAMHYWTLILLPFMSALIGVPYYLGGKSIEAQQRRIKEKHRQIYGE